MKIPSVTTQQMYIKAIKIMYAISNVFNIILFSPISCEGKKKSRGGIVRFGLTVSFNF